VSSRAGLAVLDEVKRRIAFNRAAQRHGRDLDRLIPHILVSHSASPALEHCLSEFTNLLG